MRDKPCLTTAETQAMMTACKNEAVKNQWNVSIAIVDEGGYLLHLERLDGAPPLSPEIATRKARSAALMRRPSKALEDLAKDRPGFLSCPEVILIQGGVPALYKGECVGGIGVSGVQSHQDEQIASAGVAVLG